GPVFRRVAESTLRYLGVTPSASTTNLSTVRRDGDLADAALSMGKPPTAPGSAPPPAPAPTQMAPGSVRVPDATGMPAHDVVVALTKAGLVPRIEGWGRAVRQEPAAGAAAAKGAFVRVVLEPAS